MPAVAIFDSSLHPTILVTAYTYAIPYQLAANHKIRRYGFHGISHQYLMLCYAEMTATPVARTNIITLHLGGGCSATAIHNGESVDTSMGFAPLEGLENLGLELDPALNADMEGETRITREGSLLHAYVIPTNEGLMMAQLALRWHQGAMDER